ncbi:hypothetical protein DALLNEIH_03766 [Bacillus sp. B01(2024)]
MTLSVANATISMFITIGNRLLFNGFFFFISLQGDLLPTNQFTYKREGFKIKVKITVLFFLSYFERCTNTSQTHTEKR